MSVYELQHWEIPPKLPSGYVPIRCSTRIDFIRRLMISHNPGLFCDRNMWLMTEAQRETWKNEIASNWVSYYDIINKDSTDRFRKQLRDMELLGSGLILIGQEGGMGKSELMLSLLKIWAVQKLRSTGEHIRPSIYWRKVIARRMIGGSPPHSAHGIDEDQDDSGSGSHALIKQLKNIYRTGLRKPGRLGVYAGLDVDPRELGRAVALYLKPFGFNRSYQANRFIVCNNRNEPLWLAAIQRCMLPHEELSYEGEIGTVAEYQARATMFSTDTDGVHSARDSVEELYWMEELVKHWTEIFPNIKAKAKALTFEARQLEIPEPVMDSLEEIVAAAQLRIGVLVEDNAGSSSPIPEPSREYSDEWEVLRRMVYDFHISKGTKAEQANGIAHWLTPTTERRSQGLVAEDVGTSKGALEKWISRRQTDKIMSPTEQGRIGEALAKSQVSIPGARWDGKTGQPDLLIGDDVAVNIKLTFHNDNTAEMMSCSPEYKWPKSSLLVFYPRFLDIRLFPIIPHTLDHRLRMSAQRKRGIPATWENLESTLLEMIEVAD